MTRKTAAIIGGGVIGGGWASRFLLHGWDVVLADPDPDAERKVNEVLAAASDVVPLLYDKALPQAGELRFAALSEAVSNADWVQECVPERLEIKHAVYGDIEAHTSSATIIASSTSGYKPSQLREWAKHPERIIVAHPFVPVYLLPLAEVVAGDAPDAGVVEKACELLKSIGMKPLVVRKEIDAHIADRFLEAVWREGLWLVNDGIATTEEIDDAIRMGFGLRWAQMGLFETYRLGGGEAGMVHFLEQFGPCLSWPWTKLMDVPDLTDELINTIASQSDEQSGMHDIRELERIRDSNLVGFLNVLKERNWGAGEVLQRFEKTLANNGEADLNIQDNALPVIWRGQVLSGWMDDNLQLKESRCVDIFATANSRVFNALNLRYKTVASYIEHRHAVSAGDSIHVDVQVLGVENNQVQLFYRLFRNDGRLAALAEFLAEYLVEFVGEANASAQENLKQVVLQHASFPMPAEAGRVTASTTA